MHAILCYFIPKLHWICIYWIESWISPQTLSSNDCFPPLPTCGVSGGRSHFSAAPSLSLHSPFSRWKLAKSVSGSFSDDALPFMSYRQSVCPSSLSCLLPPFFSLRQFRKISPAAANIKGRGGRKTSLSLKTRIPRQWGLPNSPDSFDSPRK